MMARGAGTSASKKRGKTALLSGKKLWGALKWARNSEKKPRRPVWERDKARKAWPIK